MTSHVSEHHDAAQCSRCRQLDRFRRLLDTRDRGAVRVFARAFWMIKARPCARPGLCAGGSSGFPGAFEALGAC
jgi:hypothetical protein